MKTTRYGLLVLLSITLFSFTATALADPTVGKGNKGNKASYYSTDQSSHGKSKARKGRPCTKTSQGEIRASRETKSPPTARQTDRKPLIRGDVTVETAHRWVTELNIDRRGYYRDAPSITKTWLAASPCFPTSPRSHCHLTRSNDYQSTRATNDTA